MVVDEALAIVVDLCVRFEGFRAKPYLCPAGKATIGIGSCSYLNGTPVRLSDPPISREAAERLLMLTLRKTYLPAVLALCPGVDNPKRLAALVDFAYNCGIGNLKASTLRRRVNAGQWDRVPTELRKWCKGGGRVLKGLVIRREAEAALI